jgi:hypothetical protein
MEWATKQKINDFLDSTAKTLEIEIDHDLHGELVVYASKEAKTRCQEIIIGTSDGDNLKIDKVDGYLGKINYK